MATFRMEDDTVIDTDKAKQEWKEATFWNGQNHISKATNDQWLHQTLYLSAKDRYYILHSSQWQGSRDTVEFVDRGQAAVWLLANEHRLPDDLQEFEKEITE